MTEQVLDAIDAESDELTGVVGNNDRPAVRARLSDAATVRRYSVFLTRAIVNAFEMLARQGRRYRRRRSLHKPVRPTSAAGRSSIRAATPTRGDTSRHHANGGGR